MIKVENVRKSFGGLEVLKDVSLVAEDGQTIVILGQSGSGKTTWLRTMNFLERADSGTITIGGKVIDMHKASRKEIQFVREHTAFVFQNYALFANKTALENVTEGLVVVRKWKKHEAEERAREILDWVGLSDKHDSYPSQLSGGQQQRVGIARAVALEPEVILFDEPTSALDPELVGETLSVIKKVAQTGIAMVVVTHEMHFARDVADRVLFMQDGVIVEQGTADEIFLAPKDERTRKFLRHIIQPEYSI